ncbi:uncharacterized protein LOC130768133, partial [Actinidia eriantha]|uniref:uncharacterized protein LOC130768133 n=1 Tax=Actinidia eriantha TaxID=165200 RepID=UPI00258FDB7D
NLLDEILETTIEIVRDPIPILDDDHKTDEGGVQVFKNAPPGIVFDHTASDFHKQQHCPPNGGMGPIMNGSDATGHIRYLMTGDNCVALLVIYSDCKLQLQSVAVDGMDIISRASEAHQKSLAKLEAKDAAAKTAAKREEERVVKLKKARGERWLPSIAREMRVKSQASASFARNCHEHRETRSI